MVRRRNYVKKVQRAGNRISRIAKSNALRGVLLLFVLALVPLASAALNDSEVWFNFDEGSGTLAADSSINGLDGTLVGATWDTGIIDDAMRRSGNSAQRTIFPDLNIVGSDDFSVSMWLYPDDVTSATFVFLTDDDQVSSGNRWFLAIEANLSVYVFSNPGSITSIRTDALTVDAWNHLVITRSGGSGNFYLNGGSAVPFSIGSGDIWGTQSNVIGGRAATNQNSDFRVDLFGVYNRVLSGAEISELYNSGAGLNPYAVTNTTGNVTFTASEIISEANITNFNVTIGASTQNNSYVWELAPANYTAVFSANGYFSKNLTVEVFENVTTQYNFTNISNHALTLTLSSAVGAGNEGLWGVNVSSDDYSYSLVEVVNVSNPVIRLWDNTTSSFTTSASFVTLETVAVNDTVIAGVASGFSASSGDTCEFRVLVTHTDGSQSVSGVRQATGGTWNTFVDFDKIPASQVDFQARRTAGSASGCRFTDFLGRYVDELYAFVYLPELIHGNYTVTLTDVGDWVENSYSVELVSSQNFTWFDIDGYIVGTVEFFFRDAENNNLLTGVQVNVSMVSNATTYSFSTSNGTFYLTNVTSDVYEVTAVAQNYSDATVFVTVAEDNQTVNMFLEAGAVQILFSVVDTLGNNVPNATLTFLRVINGTPTVVAQTVTDFSGFSFVNIIQAQNYLFTVAASGYITFSGDVTPFSSLSPYTVRLRPDAPTVDNPSTAFVQTFVRPVQALDDSWFYVEFETLSSSGVLSWFAIDSTYLSVTQSDNVSGVPGGGIVSVNFTNINISQASTVTVQFSFDAVGYEPVVWNQTFVLAEFVGGNFTIKNVFQAAANDLGVVGRHILGSIIVLLALAAGFFASSNASLTGVVGLGAIGLVTVGGLFAVNIAVLAAVFIGILVLADNVLGGGA